MAEPTARPEWSIESLGGHHSRKDFDCGNPKLTDWLRERASQFQKRDLARTYVLVRPGQPLVLGYYAISNHRVSHEALPADQAKGLPRMDIPVVLLGRLAVDRSVQGQGLGSLLLIDALKRAQSIADAIGIRAVQVDAIDDDAAGFYRKYGFIPLVDCPRHFFLPMHVIRALNLTG